MKKKTATSKESSRKLKVKKESLKDLDGRRGKNVKGGAATGVLCVRFGPRLQCEQPPSHP